MKLPAALKQIREMRTLSAVQSSIPVSYTHLTRPTSDLV